MTDETGTPEPPGARGARPRRLRAALAGGALLALLGAGWLVAGGLDARANLAAARTAAIRLHRDLAAGRPAQAGAELGTVQRHAARARRSTSGVIWWAAARLPLVGRPIRTARGLAGAVDTLARGVLPPLVGADRAVLGPASRARPDLAAELTALQDAAGPLAGAASQLAGVQTRLSALPDRTGVAGLDRARTALLRETGRLGTTVDAAATAGRLLPPLLGTGGPRRYFLALQTNAEARGTGGLVGAFAILTADRGHLAFSRFSADDSLPAAPEPVIRYGAEFDHRYAEAQSTRLLANSNLSPHFPYAARIWTRLWRQHTGQRLDGAIATDPVGLADLLTVTGPVLLPDGRRLTSANAVAFTERDMYRDYPDTPARKKALTQVAQSVAAALCGRPPAAPAMLRAFAGMAADGRLKVWSARAAEQRRLAATVLGGVLPDTSRPFAELVVNNAAASKLDYYLHRGLDYTLGPCRNGTRETTVRIRLTNSAPPGGLPDYVVNRGDDPQHAHVRGSTLSWVSLYTTRGAQLVRAALDGRRLTMSADEERGHTVLSTRVELLPGQRRDIEVHLLEPVVEGPPLVPVQPLARPQTTAVSAPACRVP